MRVLLPLDDLNGHHFSDLPELVAQLKLLGIPIGAAATMNKLEGVLIFDTQADSDRAIAWLTSIGIRAERG